ncbi:MAG: hypothetical protein WDN31_04230 [Hyphomicrobium sp.]
MAQAQKRTAVPRKKSFHHGDLREALIAATRDLLIEHGPDDFTLADACRRAGVTTAAPYSIPRQAGDPGGDRQTRLR